MSTNAELDAITVHYVRLEYHGITGGGNASHKFYESMRAPLVGFVVYRWGRIGSVGQTMMKAGPDARPEAVYRKLTDKEQDGGYDRISPERPLHLPRELAEKAMRHGDGYTIGEAVDAAIRSPNGCDHPDLRQADPSEPEPEVEGNDLSQRALSLTVLAATNPEKAMVEYAMLREDVREEGKRLKEAEHSLSVVEAMLGMDEG